MATRGHQWSPKVYSSGISRAHLVHSSLCFSFTPLLYLRNKFLQRKLYVQCMSGPPPVNLSGERAFAHPARRSWKHIHKLRSCAKSDALSSASSSNIPGKATAQEPVSQVRFRSHRGSEEPVGQGNLSIPLLHISNKYIFITGQVAFYYGSIILHTMQLIWVEFYCTSGCFPHVIYQIAYLRQIAHSNLLLSYRTELFSGGRQWNSEPGALSEKKITDTWRTDRYASE